MEKLTKIPPGEQGWFSRCPVCGKIFIHYPQHAYVRMIHGRDRKLCSYKCMREWDRKHPHQKIRKSSYRMEYEDE